MPNLVWPKNSLMQLTIIGSALGSQIVMTHHFETQQTNESANASDALMQASAEAVAATWITDLKSVYLACLANTYGMTMVRAQVLERPGLWRHRLTPTETATTGAGTGQGGFPANDNTTAGVMRWRTPQAGKAFRGRSYIGPIQDGWQNAGRLQSAGVAALDAYRTAMFAKWGPTAPPTPVWRLTVYSRPYNNGEYGYPTGHHPNKTFKYPPDYAGNSTWVTTGSTDSVLRVQRRRELGVGS